VLHRESVQRIVDELELIVRAPQPPDDFTAPAIDFGHFAQALAGKDDVAVIIDINGIHVRKAERLIHRLVIAVADTETPFGMIFAEPIEENDSRGNGCASCGMFSQCS